MSSRALRYLAPNLITAVGLVFGLLSLVAALEGRYVDGAWFIIYAVLTDRLDGLVARLVRGTSELGVQLDSLADFLNFGVCPAVLFYAALGAEPALPFGAGAGQVILMVACTTWVFGATFRLARYNISTEDSRAPKIFFGVPTTLAAGVLVIWFLALVKYAAPGDPMALGRFGGPRLLPGFETPAGLWRYLPLLLFVGGLLMASNLRMPKLGLARSRFATGFIVVNVFLGYVFCSARVFPEYLVWPPTMWVVTFLVWGQLSREARSMRPPPIFPPVDPPPGQEPIRPEDDLLPEGSDEPLDGEPAERALISAAPHQE